MNSPRHLILRRTHLGTDPRRRLPGPHIILILSLLAEPILQPSLHRSSAKVRTRVLQSSYRSNPVEHCCSCGFRQRHHNTIPSVPKVSCFSTRLRRCSQRNAWVRTSTCMKGNAVAARSRPTGQWASRPDGGLYAQRKYRYPPAFRPMLDCHVLAGSAACIHESHFSLMPAISACRTETTDHAASACSSGCFHPRHRRARLPYRG